MPFATMSQSSTDIKAGMSSAPHGLRYSRVLGHNPPNIRPGRWCDMGQVQGQPSGVGGLLLDDMLSSAHRYANPGCTAFEDARSRNTLSLSASNERPALFQAVK